MVAPTIPPATKSFYSAHDMVNAPPDLPYAGAFAGREHRFALRVYFEDTDLTGIVYHANYLRFMERARSDMLRAAGIDQRAAHEAGAGAYAVTDLAIRYRRPARLDDALVVASTLVAVRAASCVIQQRVMRGGETLTEARVTAAFVDPAGRPKRQPRAWIETFRALAAGAETMGAAAMGADAMGNGEARWRD